MFLPPASLQRLADQIDGWLDLRCPERALELLQPMLDDPTGRPAGLCMRIRAVIRQGKYAEARRDLAELASTQPANDWVEVTEAWCQRRLFDLPGAIATLERLLQRSPRSDIAHFNLACYLALQGAVDRAIDEVTIACGLTGEFRDYLLDEPDFDNLRADPRFRELVRQVVSDAKNAPDTVHDDDPDDDEDEDGDGPPGGAAPRAPRLDLN